MIDADRLRARAKTYRYDAYTIRNRPEPITPGGIGNQDWFTVYNEIARTLDEIADEENQ